MVRPISNDNGKRKMLGLVYLKFGMTALMREATRLQVTTAEARKLAQELDDKHGTSDQTKA